MGFATLTPTYVAPRTEQRVGWGARGDAQLAQLRRLQLISDRLRADAPQAVVDLKALGLPVELLSGDGPGAVASAATASGIETWQAGADPHAKATYIESLKAAGRKPLMVGDGINDAAALAAAHVAASPAGATDLAQTTADIVLQREGLAVLPEAIRIARRAQILARQNIGFSLAYNMAPPSPLKWVLRRFDHSAIYIMIAGTYTAIVAQFDDALWAMVLAGVVWTGAILGAVVKIALPGRYDRLSLIAYIALGWVGVLAIGPASASLPGVSLWLIVAGGLTYVAGVAFYKCHALRFHNAIWHLFVAIAAGLHFAAVALAVAQ